MRVSISCGLSEFKVLIFNFCEVFFHHESFSVPQVFLGYCKHNAYYHLAHFYGKHVEHSCPFTHPADTE